jgi:hypothetical protein
MSDTPRKLPKVHLAKEGHKPLVISFKELKKMINDGDVHAHDLVYYKGLGIWTKASRAKGFRTLFSNIDSRSYRADLDGYHSDNSQENIDAQPSANIHDGIRIKSFAVSPNSKFNQNDAEKRNYKPIAFKNDFVSNKKLQYSLIISAIVVSLALIAGSSFFLMSGGRKTTIVNGTISANGKLLKHGIIVFEKSTKPLLFFGAIISNGKYEIASDDFQSCGHIVRVWEVKSIGNNSFLDTWVFRSPTILDLADKYSNGLMPADYNRISNKTFNINAGSINTFNCDILISEKSIR